MAKYRNSIKKIRFNKRGLILCEGETEENYFKGLISQEKYRRKFQAVDVNIHKPKDHSPFGMVKKAKEMIKVAKQEKNSYDFVWVMFDRDGHANVPDAFELARKTKPINIAYTKPCFEFFVILHFRKTTKHYSKCDKVISDIKKDWLPDYEKASNIFKILLPFKDAGMDNGAWVIQQFKMETDAGKRVYDLPAYSNVHILVEYLYTLI